ncbi:hypothetical protein [Helicobacter pylori]|uniref:hypothetical protein n=1 Tax=Helicobacter pylori TaxID=210 RepID=UPI00311CDDBC
MKKEHGGLLEASKKAAMQLILKAEEGYRQAAEGYKKAAEAAAEAAERYEKAAKAAAEAAERYEKAAKAKDAEANENMGKFVKYFESNQP